MSYAIVEASGTQVKVEPGYFYDMNRLHVDEEGNYTFDKVLLINNDGEVTVGQPYIEGATVEGTVMSHMRGRKVLVYKMKPKKHYRKKRGHRQELTRVMIDSITLNGSLLAAREDLETPESQTSPTIASEAEVSETANSETGEMETQKVMMEQTNLQPIGCERLRG